MNLPPRFSWVRKLFGKRRRTKPALPPARFKPRLEGLEERDVPAAPITTASTGLPPMTSSPAPTNEQYVGTLYTDLLGREGTSDEILSWSNLINAGYSRANVANGILHSVEYRTDVISGYYTTLLGRQADSVGLQNYLAFMASGGTFEQIKAQIYGSKEYLTTQTDGTFTGWLTAVYQDELGRAVDSFGLASFRQANRNGVSREVIASQIVNSQEADQRLVQSWYQSYLGRPADAGGLAYWTSQLQAGRQQEVIQAQILGSNEYFFNL